MDRDEQRKQLHPFGDAKEQELEELGKRLGASKTLTDEQLMEQLKAKRLEKAKTTTPTESRPRDRLVQVDPLIALNRTTRGAGTPLPELACPECGSMADDPGKHPRCPVDQVELRPISRNAQGHILDRKCPSCDLTESKTIKDGKGHLLYSGLTASIREYARRAPLGSDFG